MNETLKQKLKMLPDSPGCYQMKHEGRIIYVGKAVNLKNRVRSYFHGHDHTPKVSAMVSQIDDFDVILCRSNLEALILESNLIKLHQPYFNILLKDDKRYPLIRLDFREPYPKLTIVRRRADDGARYFGPYTGGGAVREVLETTKKLFPLRTCSQPLPASHPSRPCINYEIGRCLAPCAQKCSEEEYLDAVQRASAFLSGEKTEVIQALRSEMLSASRLLQYERAAALRDRISDIEGLLQKQQAMQIRRSEQDVLSIAQDGADAMVYMLKIRDGKILEGNPFYFPREGSEPAGEVLLDFILQYYSSFDVPKELLVESLPDSSLDDLHAFLQQKHTHSLSVSVPSRGAKRGLILLCKKNAQDALEKQKAKKQIQYERTVGACRELAAALGLNIYPRRIEGFDISNTQGSLSVASMVVFIDGVPAPKEYRRFRIKTVEGANDFASLNEVLQRRFVRTQADSTKDRWPVPDLILIDGGPEQLAFSRKAMLETGACVPMFGLAKKREEIYLPDQAEPILLDHHTYALQLIERVRDESHRFAITFHRSLRSKESTHSVLDNIAGIGETRRKALLKAFGSIARIKNASPEELASVKGMDSRSARSVFNAFHPE